MKKLPIFRFLITLMLLNATAQLSAQNYRVLQPGRTTQYMDKWGYLLAMRVDSVIISGTDTNYFLLKNLQKMDWNCFHIQGPSWMGDRVTIHPNGETSFYNIYDQPVLIKTRAALNDEWICYTETGLSFRANVSSVGVEDILGIIDSVKTISFQALNSDGQNIDHVVNNMNLILSKNYGLVKTLNFFDFPNFSFGVMVHGIDELILKGYNNPETGIQNLTWKQVHDHNIGDELHTKSTESQAYYSKYTENISTLLDKEINGDTIVYTWENKTKISTYTPDNNTFTANIDTITINITDDANFDNLAGNAWQNWDVGYTINYMGVGEHGLTKTYGSLNTFFRGYEIYLGDTCYTPIIYDGCLSEITYYKGLGGPYYYCSFGIESSIRELVYYKKDGVEWGTPLEFTVNTTQLAVPSPALVSIYPNPAKGHIHLNIKGNTGNFDLKILDCSGREVTGYFLKGETNLLDLNNINPGIYIFKITTGERSFSEKVVIEK